MRHPFPGADGRAARVIGVGNRWRGDDAAGIEVARRCGAELVEGDLSALIEKWRGADSVIVVDAACSGAAPGTVHRIDATAAPLPVRLSRSSTHSLGLAETIELARMLDGLPRRLVVYAIEARSFGIGQGLTPEVERAVTELVLELEPDAHPAVGGHAPAPCLAVDDRQPEAAACRVAAAGEAGPVVAHGPPDTVG